MTSISKNMYTDKLDYIVNKHNNIYRIIKMKPVDVKSNTYIKSGKEINNKDPKFKIGDTIRISKYQNIFTKGYVPDWSKEVFVIKNVKNTMPWCHGHMLLVILTVKNLLKRFTKKNCKKQIKKNLELKK